MENRSGGRVRVLYVLGRMQPGGIEVRLLDVMRSLPRELFQIDVCALSGLTGALDGAVRELGGEVILMPLLRLDFARRFGALLRRNQYDVVHANVHHTSGILLALARRAKIPRRVANFHVTDDGQPGTWRRRIQRRAMRFLIDQFATDIVGCCETVLEQAWSPQWRTDARCRAIYYGAEVVERRGAQERSELRTELGIHPDAPLFLHLGRCSPDDQKNHGRLLAIFAEVRRLAPSARLVLAGSGTDDPDGQIVPLIRKLNLQDCVMPLGIRGDVSRLLAASDALLLPSRFEGLPNVVLEACAMGVPVLATDLGGVREIGARLSLVRWLPLSASDTEWALTAAQLPAEAERLNLKHTAAAAFRASVFHLDRFAEAHRRLWGQSEAGRLAACS